MTLFDCRLFQFGRVRINPMSVNISKLKLLKLLWENSQSASFFTHYRLPPPVWDEVNALKATKKYIDYFQGRRLKADLSGNTTNPCIYNRDHGPQAFEKMETDNEKEDENT